MSESTAINKKFNLTIVVINCRECALENGVYNVMREHDVIIGPFRLTSHNEGGLDKAAYQTICKTCGYVSESGNLINSFEYEYRHGERSG